MIYLDPSKKEQVSDFASQTTQFIEESILPKVTSFNPEGEQPIYSLDKWKGIKCATVLHFQHNDKSVSNDDDGVFAKTLLSVKPKNTWIIPGNNGGHNYYHETTRKVIHALNKRNGCSYLNDEKLLKKGEEILQQSQPTVDSVEKYLSDYYAECEKEK